MDLKDVDKESDKLYKAFVKEVSIPYQDALTNIKGELTTIYAKYSKDGKLDMTVMSIKDRNKVTRLQKLVLSIDDELNSLNRGRPQQMAGYLTNVYDKNYTMTSGKIASVANVSFGGINRQAVYESAVSPLGKIGLVSNADRVKINMQRAITNSIVRGDGIQAMSSAIKTVLEGNANDTVRIARTESNRILNQARYDVYEKAKELGVQMEVEWVSRVDDRTRRYSKGDKADHVRLNGERVKLGQRFSNGLLKPGDESAGKPEETINCRCTTKVFLTKYEK